MCARRVTGWRPRRDPAGPTQDRRPPRTLMHPFTANDHKPCSRVPSRRRSERSSFRKHDSTGRSVHAPQYYGCTCHNPWIRRKLRSFGPSRGGLGVFFHERNDKARIRSDPWIQVIGGSRTFRLGRDKRLDRIQRINVEHLISGIDYHHALLALNIY